jgi:hypothetical protein
MDDRPSAVGQFRLKGRQSAAARSGRPEAAPAGPKRKPSGEMRPNEVKRGQVGSSSAKSPPGSPPPFGPLAVIATMRLPRSHRLAVRRGFAPIRLNEPSGSGLVLCREPAAGRARPSLSFSSCESFCSNLRACGRADWAGSRRVQPSGHGRAMRGGASGLGVRRAGRTVRRRRNWVIQGRLSGRSPKKGFSPAVLLVHSTFCSLHHFYLSLPQNLSQRSL